jgi:diacylglycerol kinase family enzyme
MFGEESELYRDLKALTQGSVHPIDLIDCNGRYSVNICCVGIDARVGADVHKYSGIPVIGGAGGYVISVLVHIFKGISRKMKISCGDYYKDADTALVCACNGRFYGGGFNPSLNARPDDGILDIYIIKRLASSLLQDLSANMPPAKLTSSPNMSHIFAQTT